MKEIKRKGNKTLYEKIKGVYDNNYCYYRSLYYWYNTHSQYKDEAYKRCEKLRVSLEGVGGDITSANSQCFTYCFTFINENGNKCFAYITKDYDRYIILD